jgi:hypothetical protein
MAKTIDNRQWMRKVLRHETAERTPRCPDPETLLDWLEQGDKHPEADQLLAHLFSCAHCRQQRVALREIRVLSGVEQIEPGILSGLPAKVEKWVRELIAEGMIAPVAQVRTALGRLQGMAPARGLESLSDLWPAGTAIRTGRPTLRWSGGLSAREYKIVILLVGRNGLQPAWEGSGGSEQQLTLPEEAELKPGNYLWQVVALTEHEKVPSNLVGFVVLREPMRQEIEALERKVENSPLARIGLYEAYGLYEEALQQVEALLQLNAEDETARRIHKQLLQLLSISLDPPPPLALPFSTGETEG